MIKREKIVDWTEKAAVLTIIVLVLAFMLVLSSAAFLQTSYLNTDHSSGENIDIISDNVFLNIILTVLFVSAAYLAYEYWDWVKPRWLEYILYGCMFLFGCLFIMTTKLAAPVYSDSFILTDAALQASRGFYYDMESYFARFPFQLGYVLYSEIFFRVVQIFLPNAPEGYYFLALQGMNLLWLILSYFALLRITDILFADARVQRLCTLVMLFAMQPVLSCTFLYGNIPAFSCGVIAVWMFLLFMQQEKLRYAIACALSLTLAVCLKLNLMIFLVAIGGTWIVKLVRKFSVKSLLCLVLCAVCVLSISKLPQLCYEKRSGYEFGDGIPMVGWLAMGMSEGHAAAGWYKEDHTVTAFKESGNDPEATAEKAKKVVAERLSYFASQPGEALAFFSEKLRSQWNEPSYDSIWLNQVFISFSEKGGLYDIVCDKQEDATKSLMNQHQQMVFFGMLLACVFMLKNRDILKCILPLIILGGLMYHLLFEAKSQYALPYYILMFPMAAYGFGQLFERLKKRVA